MTTRKNPTTKALQSHMAKAKKHNPQARLEWEMSCNTNNQRGKVYDQHELLELYSRRIGTDCENGFSKVCHLYSHEGKKFDNIVLKRHQHGRHADHLGNQLIAEIECWNELAETADADLLCPVLKYFTSKSDKVSETSETMKRNVIIIAQKAVFVGDVESACEEAERLNAEKGINDGIEPAEERYEAMRELARRRRWRDVMWNDGNSGVIFDYAKGCYKAVFIDYAL
jgi:hypothetical protein